MKKKAIINGPILKSMVIFFMILAIVFLVGCSINKVQNVLQEPAQENTAEKSGEPGEQGLPESRVLLITGEWPPFTSEKLEDYGFFTALVASVFEEMNISYTIKFYPWNRCEMLVKEGDAFAAFPYTYTEERAKNYLFSESLYNVETRLFYYKKNKTDFKFENIEDLRAYRIAGIAGYFYLEIFNKSSVKYDYVDNEDIALQKLIEGKIDLVPFTSSNGWELIRSKYPNETGEFGTLDKPLDSNSIGLIISKDYRDSAELLNQFNSAFARTIENGKYQEIVTAKGQQEGSIAQLKK